MDEIAVSTGQIQYSIITPMPAAVYAGPGDVVAGAAAWWGLRAYTLASIGVNAVRLRESGGNTEADFPTIAGGGLDLAAISSFKGANNLFVVRLYDQTGNGFDVAQGTAASQPGFTLSGLGALPIMSFGGQLFSSGSLAGFSAGTASLSVALKNNTFSAAAGVFGTASPSSPEIYHSASNTISLYDGTTLSGTGNDNAWHAVQGVFSGSSGVIAIDGTETSGSLNGTNAVSGVVRIGLDAFSQVMNGFAVEFGFWNANFTSGQRTSMNSNQRAYWGF